MQVPVMVKILPTAQSISIIGAASFWVWGPVWARGTRTGMSRGFAVSSGLCIGPARSHDRHG